MSRTVICKKFGKESCGLENPPFEGALGHAIFENVSVDAWSLWMDTYMMRVINEYRLDLVDKEHYNCLLREMASFLELDPSLVDMN